MPTISLHSSAHLSSSSKRTINATLHIPKQLTTSHTHLSIPKLPISDNLVQELIIKDKSFTNKIPFKNVPPVSDIATLKLCAILESVADRIEMHANVGEQRENWNSLLLNSINMITLTATTMVGIGNGDGNTPNLALNLGATLLFMAAMGMLVVMNKIQPSQLVEEQRNATRLFKKLHNEIETFLALNHVPSQENVEEMMEKVLALDKAYPLPLIGVMLEKFPKKHESAVWWPRKFKAQSQNGNGFKKNGWNEEMEKEMREVIEVIKEKDREDYERLGNIGLKVNKVLAISGPVLTGIAAVGSMFLGHNPMAGVVASSAGSLAAIVNTLEHGGQVGMVIEMYRNCGGFFKLMEESIESTLEEKDLEKRENGELFEMKLALQLGRSLSQLKEISEKSASFRKDGKNIDEFASKLF